MLRASSLLLTSTTIQALWTPSLQPKSAWVRKCEPVSSRSLLARAQATTPDSCGTSSRNLAMGNPPRFLVDSSELYCDGVAWVDCRRCQSVAIAMGARGLSRVLRGFRRTSEREHRSLRSE